MRLDDGYTLFELGPLDGRAFSVGREPFTTNRSHNDWPTSHPTRWWRASLTTDPEQAQSRKLRSVSSVYVPCKEMRHQRRERQP